MWFSGLGLVSLAIADIQLVLDCFKAVFGHLLTWQVPKTLLKALETASLTSENQFDGQLRTGEFNQFFCLQVFLSQPGQCLYSASFC